MFCFISTTVFLIIINKNTFQNKITIAEEKKLSLVLPTDCSLWMIIVAETAYSTEGGGGFQPFCDAGAFEIEKKVTSAIGFEI